MTSASVLTAAGLYAPEALPGPVAVTIQDGKVGAVRRGLNRQLALQRALDELGADAEVIDLGPLSLAPGFVDLHTHGFRGHDLTTGPATDGSDMAAELPSTGVTAFLATIASTGREETPIQIRRMLEARQTAAGGPCAEMLGIRLEGPFISFEKRGAQHPAAIRPPDPVELETLLDIGQGLIRMVDFAPEEDQGLRFLASLVRHGVLPVVGHTVATYEQVIHALDGGARHCTHLFNAMPPLDHRAPGAPGALLTDERATVEVIADGIHLHPALLRLVIAARGPQAVATITDAVGAAGLPDGTYQFVEREVYVRDGGVRLEDGTLAGSALTLDAGVRNLVKLVGLSWSDAIRMATLTPARIAGVDDRKGRIAPGVDADLVAMDGEGQIRRTWTRGRLAFELNASA
jgi:N-acetylglucosamine-6-phosphate deacetylase